jgi:hypothetical protein
MKNLFISNIKIILIAILLITGSYLLYKNFTIITNWIKSIFTNIAPSDTPTSVDLKNPNYILSSKIIKNYVDQIVTSVDKYGTDEITLNKVYQNLQHTSKENVINLWNEFTNRNYIYSPLFGQFLIGITIMSDGAKYNLYEVLKFELRDNQSEKNCLINWTSLFRLHGLIS